MHTREFGVLEVACGDQAVCTVETAVQVRRRSTRRVEVGVNTSVKEAWRPMEAKFEVSNVRKPIMAVARVVDAGNVVQFGPSSEDNSIRNVGQTTRCTCVGKAAVSYWRQNWQWLLFNSAASYCGMPVIPLMWKLWEMRKRRGTSRMEVRLMRSQKSRAGGGDETGWRD